MLSRIRRIIANPITGGGVGVHVRAWITRHINRETPEAYLNRRYLEIQKQLVDARRSAAVAVAREKHVSQRLEEQKKRLAACDERAIDALRTGDEERAREEMNRKSRETEYVRDLERECARNHVVVEELRRNLRRLQDRGETAQQKKKTLMDRLRDDTLRDSIRRLIDEVGDTSPLEVFDFLEELSRPIPERDPDMEIAAMTDPTGAELLEDLKRRVREPGEQ